MGVTYRNPWHNPRTGQYGPAFYQTDTKPVKYKGYLIYERIEGRVWDVVLNGACLTQRAGPNGARAYIDQRILRLATRREDAIGEYVARLSDDEVQVLAGVAEVVEPEDENPPVEALRERLICEMETGSFTPGGFKFN